MKRPELLAPAGSPEAFWAAFQAGADAVYLGTGAFNARTRARNFSTDELRMVTETAHVHGRRVYLTLNTLVFDREIASLVEVLDLASDTGVDALIVQDWGVAAIVRRWYPDLALHASTQMFSHTRDHVAFLRDQGFARVILPRELTLDEIRRLIEREPFSYEVFVHGAMCCAFSGCCLFSSYRFGESGNRGSCRQLCRYLFTHDGLTDYPFSLRDMNTLPLIRELADAGIDSFKIEGRLKPAATVGETVAAYRQAIDRLESGGQPGTVELTTFRREEHTGYLASGPDYHALVNRSSGTVGEKFGTVTGIEGAVVTARLDRPVHKGVRIRIQDARGRNMVEATLLDYSLRKTGAGEWSLRWTLPRFRPEAGLTEPLTLYRIGTSAPRDVIRLLEQARGPAPREAFDVSVRITPGNLTVGAASTLRPAIPAFSYDCPTQPPKTAPLDPEKTGALFRETHTHPFRVETVDVFIEGDLFCPLSVLKDLRRRAFDDLAAYLERDAHSRADERRTGILTALAALQISSPPGASPRRFVYCPPGESSATVPAVIPVTLDTSLELSPDSSVVLLPPLFVPPLKHDRWIDRIAKLADRGFRRFIAPSFGWLLVLSAAGTCEIIAGPFFYLVNSFAVDWGMHNGLDGFILAGDIPETDLVPVGDSSHRIILDGAPREQFATRLPLPPGPYRLGRTIYRAVNHGDYTTLVEHADE